MTRAKSVLSALLLVAAATLGSTGTAQAAIYTGNWDPAYGPKFPQLGWNAEGTFFVPDACLASDGTNIQIAGNCAGFAVLSGEVDFYNIANPSTILESFSLDTNVIVNGIDITGGQLTGLQTGFFDYFVPTLSIAGGGAYSFSLLLYGGDQAQLFYENPTTLTPGCAFLVPGANCGISANAATGVFALAAVPRA